MSEKKNFVFFLLWSCRTYLILTLSVAFGWKEHAFVGCTQTLNYLSLNAKVAHAVFLHHLSLYALCTPILLFRISLVPHLVNIFLNAMAYCLRAPGTKTMCLAFHFCFAALCMRTRDGPLFCASTIALYALNASRILGHSRSRTAEILVNLCYLSMPFFIT